MVLPWGVDQVVGHMKLSIKVTHVNCVIYQDEQGRLHREDGPAGVWDDGYEEWCINGDPHRVEGPARIWGNGSREWWVKGRYVKSGVA